MEFPTTLYPSLTQKTHLRLCFSITLFVLCMLSFTGTTQAFQNTTSASNDQKREAIGREFAQALLDKDSQKLEEMIDFDRLFMPTARAVTNNKKEQKDFLTGMKSTGVPNLINSVVQSIDRANGNLAYKRLVSENGNVLPLIRLDVPEGGTDFILLKLNKNNYKINDIYIATSGRFMSEQFKETVALMMPPSKSVFAAIFKSFSVDEAFVNKLKKIGQLNQAGRIQESYNEINTLPEEARNSRPLLNMAIQLSQYIGDDAYLSELERLAAHHGDEPSLQFMLVDYYFMAEDFQSAQKAISSLSSRFGPDAAIANLQASLNIATNNPQQAIEYANQSIALEADYEQAHWMLVTALVNAQDYAKMPAALKRIGELFGYQFSRENFEADPFYTGFVKSQAFKQWMGN